MCLSITVYVLFNIACGQQSELIRALVEPRIRLQAHDEDPPTTEATTPANRNQRAVLIVMDQAQHPSMPAGAVPSKCCLNGGTCVLGTFCHCKKKYFGRYCEHRLRGKSCGALQHLDIRRDACNVCQCHDGILLCQVTLDADCDQMELGYDTSVLNYREEQNPELPRGIQDLVESSAASVLVDNSSMFTILLSVLVCIIML